MKATHPEQLHLDVELLALHCVGLKRVAVVNHALPVTRMQAPSAGVRNTERLYSLHHEHKALDLVDDHLFM